MIRLIEAGRISLDQFVDQASAPVVLSQISSDAQMQLFAEAGSLDRFGINLDEVTRKISIVNGRTMLDRIVETDNVTFASQARLQLQPAGRYAIAARTIAFEDDVGLEIGDARLILIAHRISFGQNVKIRAYDPERLPSSDDLPYGASGRPGRPAGGREWTGPAR